MTQDPEGYSVLFLVHSLPPYEFSGTPEITHEYARHLTTRGIRVAVLYPNIEDPGYNQARILIDPAEAFKRYEVPFPRHRDEDWALHDASDATPERSRLLGAVLDDFRPSLVHVIDLFHLPGEWVETIKARGLPILRQVWNAEDLCGRLEPTYPLPPALICPAPITPRQCAECYSRSWANLSPRAGERERALGTLERALTRKREQARRAFLAHYDRIVFPTQSFREFFERTLPLPADRTRVIEPGIDLQVDRNSGRPDPAGRIRFLFLGILAPRKGISDLQAVFTHPALTSRDDYALTVFGEGDPGMLSGLLAANPRVRYQGAFRPEQLPSILQAADVGLSPSHFETFHRVTREYLRAGLPVIGSTAFGIPDAVLGGSNGLVFNVGDVDEFRRALLAVLEDRALLTRLTAGAADTPIRTTEEELEDLIPEYRAILNEP